MKRAAGGEEERRIRRRTPARYSFVTEVEYVNRLPHIVTVRPIQMPATVDVTSAARQIARRLIETTNSQTRTYLGRRRRFEMNIVLNGIFYL